MFVYTVYPVTGTARSKRVPAIRPVDRVAGVKPARAVQRTWTAQYGNAGQSGRAYELQAVPGNYPRTLRETRGNADNGAAQGQKAESKVSAPVYIQNMQRLISLRKSGATVDPDYIHKYMERLGNMKKNTNAFEPV